MEHNVEALSFEELYPALLQRAEAVARRILGGSSTAEDVAAEALARAWVHWSTVSATDSPFAWIARVSANLSIDTARRQRHAAPPTDACQDASEQSLLREALVDALASLPSRQREVIVLRYLAGLTPGEAASALGIARSTTSVHLHRGTVALRKDLAEHSISPSVKRERTNMKITNHEQLQAAHAAGTVITGRAVEVVRGGLTIDIGMLAHLPARAVELTPIAELSAYVGRDLDVVITGIGKGRSPIVSRARTLESAEDKERRQAALRRLDVGSRVRGRVINFVPFGAFVDLGSGVRGLLHTTALGDREVAVNDDLELEVDALSAETERVSLCFAGDADAARARSEEARQAHSGEVR